MAINLSARPRVIEISLENQLLAACCRVKLDSRSAERIQKCVEHPIHWDQLIQAASKQAVLPLLYHQLHSTARQYVPERILVELRRYGLATALRNQFLSQALHTVLDVLRDDGIRAIPYKGLLLAATAYGNLALRQVGDLDLWVHPSDYLSGRALLTAHGYEPIPEFDLGWESAFRSPNNRVAIDLHQALLPHYFGVRLNFDVLWERCVPVDVAGKTVPNLAPEDVLSVLCLQLFKDVAHQRLVLRQICDIAELLRAYPQLEWSQLESRTAARGMRRQLCLGLRVAHEVLGAELSDPALRMIKSELSLGPLVRKTISDLFIGRRAGDSATSQILHEHLCIARWGVGPARKLGAAIVGVTYLLRIRPTDRDRELIPLPASLSFLYYLIRPLRLMVKHLLLRPAERFLPR